MRPSWRNWGNPFRLTTQPRPQAIWRRNERRGSSAPAPAISAWTCRVRLRRDPRGAMAYRAYGDANAVDPIRSGWIGPHHGDRSTAAPAARDAARYARSDGSARAWQRIRNLRTSGVQHRVRDGDSPNRRAG